MSRAMGTVKMTVDQLPVSLREAILNGATGRSINAMIGANFTDDADRRPLTSAQLDALFNLMVMNTLANHLDVLEERFGDDRRALVGVRSLQNTVNYVASSVMDTVPMAQMKRIRRMLAEMSYTVGVKCAATKDRQWDEYGTFFSWREWDLIVSRLLDGCQMCDLQPNDERQCPLKKLLDSMPNDVKPHKDGMHRCQYRLLV